MTRTLTFELYRGSGSARVRVGTATGRAWIGTRYSTVYYQGRRYQLCGGLRVNYFINLDRPIPRKARAT